MPVAMMGECALPASAQTTSADAPASGEKQSRDAEVERQLEQLRRAGERLAQLKKEADQRLAAQKAEADKRIAEQQAAKKAAADKIAAQQAAAKKLAEDKAAADKAAAEQLAAQQAAAKKLAQEKAAAAKAAAEQLAEQQAVAKRLQQEKAAADKAAAKKLAQEKAAAAKAAAEQLAELQAAAKKLQEEKAAADRAAAKRIAQQKAGADKASAEEQADRQAAAIRFAAAKAAADKAEKELAAEHAQEQKARFQESENGATVTTAVSQNQSSDMTATEKAFHQKALAIKALAREKGLERETAAQADQSKNQSFKSVHGRKPLTARSPHVAPTDGDVNKSANLDSGTPQSAPSKSKSQRHAQSKASSPTRNSQLSQRFVPPPPPEMVPSELAAPQLRGGYTQSPSLPLAQVMPAGQPAVKLLPPTEQEQMPSRTPLTPDEAAPEPGEVAPPPYVLERGDSVRITDYSGSDLHNMLGTQIAVVQEDGTMSVYPVGVIHAAGKTIQQLNDLINEKAKKYVYEPQFLVSLMHTRPIVVYVLGEVANPGVYTLNRPGQTEPNAQQQEPQAPPVAMASASAGKQPITLSEETSVEGKVQISAQLNTVLIALEKAGGLRDGANIRDIRVNRRSSGQVFHVDIWKLLVDGDASQDMELQPHDTVFVPPGVGHFDPTYLGQLAANHHRQVRVWGSVRAPGLYSLGPRDDVMSVIARAGGFTPNAYKGSVVLSRINPDGTLFENRVSISEALRSSSAVARMPLQSGDVIIATDNPALSLGKPLLKGASVVGAAWLLLYLGSQIRNVNVTAGNPNNVRVISVP